MPNVNTIVYNSTSQIASAINTKQYEVVGINTDTPTVILMSEFKPLYDYRDGGYSLTNEGQFLQKQLSTQNVLNTSIRKLLKNLKTNTSTSKMTIQTVIDQTLSLLQSAQLVEPFFDIKSLKTNAIVYAKSQTAYNNQLEIESIYLNRIPAIIPSEITISDLLKTFGYTQIEKWSPMKLYQQLLIELRHLIVSQSPVFSFETNSRTTSISLTNHQNGIFIPNDIVLIPPWPVSDVQRLLYSNLVVGATDYSSNDLINYAKGVVNSLMPYKSKFQGDKCICQLAMMLSKEFNISTALNSKEVLSALSGKWMPPPLENVENDYAVIDAIIGKFITDVNQPHNTLDNSLINSAYTIDFDGNYVTNISGGSDCVLKSPQQHYVDETFSNVIKDNNGNTKFVTTNCDARIKQLDDNLNTLQTFAKYSNLYGAKTKLKYKLSTGGSLVDVQTNLTNHTKLFEDIFNMMYQLSSTQNVDGTKTYYVDEIDKLTAVYVDNKIEKVSKSLSFKLLCSAALADVTTMTRLMALILWKMNINPANTFANNRMKDIVTQLVSSVFVSQGTYKLSNKQQFMYASANYASTYKMKSFVESTTKVLMYGADTQGIDVFENVVSYIKAMLSLYENNACRSTTTGFKTSRFGGYSMLLIALLMTNLVIRITAQFSPYSLQASVATTDTLGNGLVVQIDSQKTLYGTKYQNIENILEKEYGYMTQALFSIEDMIQKTRSQLSGFISSINGISVEKNEFRNLLSTIGSDLIKFASPISRSHFNIVKDTQLSLPKNFDPMKSQSVDELLDLIDTTDYGTDFYNLLLSHFKQQDYSISNKSFNKKIISVGIPNGMSEKLRKASYYENDAYENDIISIMITKIDNLQKDIVFNKKEYMFELSRFVKRDMTSIKSMKDLTSSDDVITNIQTYNFANLDNQNYQGKTYPESLSEQQYSNLTQTGKKNMIYNHIMSFFLSIYMQKFTGVKLMEEQYSLADNTIDTQLSTFIASQFVNTNLISPKFVSETTDYLTNRLKSVDNQSLIMQLMTPKKFDRIFNILFDPDDFTIDLIKTASTDVGKKVLNQLLTTGKMKQKSGVGILSKKGKQDISFDSYFVTVRNV